MKLITLTPLIANLGIAGYKQRGIEIRKSAHFNPVPPQQRDKVLKDCLPAGLIGWRIC